MTCLVIWIPLLYGYHVIGFASKLFMIKKAFAWSDISSLKCGLEVSHLEV